MPEQALSGVEYLILPIAQADRVPREWREKTLLELPRVMFGAGGRTPPAALPLPRMRVLRAMR